MVGAASAHAPEWAARGLGACNVLRARLGAAKKREETVAPERADELADVVLEDADGGQVRLGDLWRDRPAVLVFLRHYG